MDQKLKQLKFEFKFLRKMEKALKDDAEKFPPLSIGEYHGDLLDIISKIIADRSTDEDMDLALLWIDIRMKYLLNSTLDKSKLEACRFIILDLVNSRLDLGLFSYKHFAQKYAEYIMVDGRFGRMYTLIYRKGTPDLHKLVIAKKITVNNAAHTAGQSPDTQDIIINQIKNGIKYGDITLV